MIPELRNSIIDHLQGDYNANKSPFLNGTPAYSEQFFNNWRDDGFFHALNGLKTFVITNSNIPNPTLYSFETIIKGFLQSQGFELYAPNSLQFATENGMYPSPEDQFTLFASKKDGDTGWSVQEDGQGKTIYHDPNARYGMTRDQAEKAAHQLEKMETNRLW